MALLNNSQLKKKSYLNILARLLGSELIGLSFALFYVVAKQGMGVFANIIFGFCTLGCMLCLYADYCLKLGGKMGGNVRLHEEKPCPKHGIALGIVSIIPYYVTYIFLIFSKLGAVGNFFGWFRLINAPYLPILDLFAGGDVKASAIPADYLVVFAILPVLSIVVCHICFKISYERIDVAQKVLYKKQD